MLILFPLTMNRGGIIKACQFKNKRFGSGAYKKQNTNIEIFVTFVIKYGYAINYTKWM